jgi:hypothetical protein
MVSRIGADVIERPLMDPVKLGHASEAADDGEPQRT